MKRLTGRKLDEGRESVLRSAEGDAARGRSNDPNERSGVANDARMRVYKDNADIIEGLQWVSTLDLRTTVECAAMDGLVWDLNGNPIGHGMTLDPPPCHWNCRVFSLLQNPSVKWAYRLTSSRNPRGRAWTGRCPENQTFEKWIKGWKAGFIRR